VGEGWDFGTVRQEGTIRRRSPPPTIGGLVADDSSDIINSSLFNLDEASVVSGQRINPIKGLSSAPQ
jgi:hypothetical protein